MKKINIEKYILKKEQSLIKDEERLKIVVENSFAKISQLEKKIHNLFREISLLNKKNNNLSKENKFLKKIAVKEGKHKIIRDNNKKILPESPKLK
jgi:regulator of replication initiation timing